MSFLADQNLSFHRFSDGTISCQGNKVLTNDENRSQIWTTSSPLDFSTITDTTLIANESAKLPTVDELSNKDASTKRSSSYSVSCNNSVDQSLQNGSTLKLIQLKNKEDSDSSSKQVCVEFTNLMTISDVIPSSEKNKRDVSNKIF